MKHFLRFFVLIYTVLHYRLFNYLPKHRQPFLLRACLKVCYIFVPAHRSSTDETRLRHALETLGPIYIKFGQILSTRSDLLPDDLAEDLAKLQDNVTPFASDIAIAKIERALGSPISDNFLAFSDKPLASASIAQVHEATLKNGQEVVIKVLRPHLIKHIERDCGLLLIFAKLLAKFHPDGKRLKPVEVILDFKQTLFDELDLQREAANCSQLRRNFEHSPLLYIPQIIWEYTHTDILVMEKIKGLPVTNLKALAEHGINLKRLAERGVEVFFTQVFRDSFFHADMHPGNIFVNPLHGDEPQYIAVDFGIVGSLTSEDQHYLAQNLLAFFNRDYRQVALLHIESGWVPSNTRVNEFEAAIRAVCEPIFERPLKDISFGFVLHRLFQTASRFQMEVQPQLVLLQKTLINIEGLGRTLYPDLDLWHTAKPFLETHVKNQLGFKALYLACQAQLPKLLDIAPQLIHDSLSLQVNQAKHHSPPSKILEAQIELDKQTLQFYKKIAMCTAAILCVGAIEYLEAWHTQPMLICGGILAVFWLMIR